MQQAEPWWEEVYRKAFPGFASMTDVRNDGWAQRGGIDRIIVLNSGKVISVDEKVRARDYGDVLLEYWSNAERKKLGWIAKDLACDYIAYAVEPSRRCTMFPFLQLRSAWLRNGRAWVRDYQKVEAPNAGPPPYTTVSVAVPIAEIVRAINDAMSASW